MCLRDALREENLWFCVCGYRGLFAFAENIRRMRRHTNRQTGCVAEFRDACKFRPVRAVEKDQNARRESLGATNFVI
jgi:hypothetical protein